MSSFITITGSTMATGDDCVSLGEGVSNAWIENIKCGPGHGISIGSLGDGTGTTMVQNVTVSSVVFTEHNMDLGLRHGRLLHLMGFVRDITFQHGTMKNSSGIKISKVTFSDVHGTSSTQVAVKLDCSKSNPCQGIQLTNIKLSYNGKNPELAKSFCRNVKGKNSGFVVPPSCL
ncbi:hypothetical protein IEQ34_010719 [Dendrobium chrysotoxum]|uniref:Polygalacturonase n=1 Tax=Dendrobium chrysotoxum TaxID=161865 RepID=A0AAV7GVK0_DENCH|nr:hypothetical protein IEQ34_010719 [Dendrobium chrysotoxum]